MGVFFFFVFTLSLPGLGTGKGLAGPSQVSMLRDGFTEKMKSLYYLIQVLWMPVLPPSSVLWFPPFGRHLCRAASWKLRKSAA